MILVRIYCDSCGWEKKNQTVREWINVPCPNCKMTIPINRGDFRFYQFIRTIKVVSDIYSFLKPNSKKKTIFLSSNKWHDKCDSI